MNTLIPGVLWALLLIFGRFPSMDTAPTRMEEKEQQSVKLRNEFSSSLKLSRRVLRESKELISSYTWKMPGASLDFTDISQKVPSVSISSKEWMKLQKVERLGKLFEALEVYPVYLEELERWESDDSSVQADDGSSNVSGRITSVRLDLRDLLRHIRLQLSYLGVNLPSTLTPERPNSKGSNWCSRVEMYKVLKSMKKALQRTVRDYTILLR